MAQVSITIEGEADEVRAALGVLLGSATIEPLSGEPGHGVEFNEVRSPSRLPWTAEDLAYFWDYLTPDAQRVLATIAQRPDGYSFSDLEIELASDMKTIGGNLSSVGHAMRRLYGAGDIYLRPWPLSKDAAMRRYSMEEDIADTIRELWEKMTQGD